MNPITIFSILIIFAILLYESYKWLFLYLPRNSKTKHWNQTKGKIIESSIQRECAISGNRVYDYSPKIVTTYSVKDINYKTKKISIDDLCFKTRVMALVSFILNKYRVNKEVTVYYNPTDPNDAIIENGFSTILFINLGIKIFFSLILGVIATAAYFIKS